MFDVSVINGGYAAGETKELNLQEMMFIESQSHTEYDYIRWDCKQRDCLISKSLHYHKSPLLFQIK